MEHSAKMQEILTQLCIPGADNIRGNIMLPDSLPGARVTWSSSDPQVITDRETEGKAAGVVTRQAQDVTVRLTATVTLESGTERNEAAGSETAENETEENGTAGSETVGSAIAGGEIAEKVLEVCVKKAPAPIVEEDYEGYLFGHFIGEGAENEEQIYFALSEDGLHFQDRNGGQPILVSTVGEKGVRDPYLCRSYEGDRFFLIATDLSIYHRGGWFLNEQGYYDPSTTGSSNLVLWESEDLVHWGEPRLLPVAPANAGMAWAPEMVYHEETGQYIIFFASSIMNPETKYKAKPNAIYYVATRDFEHFSETRIFIDNQTDGAADGKPREIIDTTVIKIGDVYYSASKDGDNAEANGGIRILRNRNLLDANGWEKVLDLDELGLDVSGLGIDRLDNSTLEGPELFRYNKKDWADPEVPEYGLIADQYSIGAGYLPLTTTDLEDADNGKNSWKLLAAQEYSFDKLKKRHGTILRLTKAEVERLKTAF